jgi:ABC-2 type transport system ATP-binding protein
MTGAAAAAAGSSAGAGAGTRTGAPALVCTSLSKWYGHVLGIGDVTLAIGAGVTGLLGPNGAGKSTFLKLLCGQLRPSRGEVRVLGETPWDNPRVTARLGFAPEQDALYDGLTGLEFVTALTRLHGFDAATARARARAALERVGLADAMDRACGGYSRGMRQRAKLAQALAHDPDVVVLDEPLNGVDPLSRVALADLIRDLGAQGRTVLVSSHVLHEVEAMTRNIVLLAQGRLVADGNIDAIRALIDTQPHRVSVTCDRARELAAQLMSWDEVVSVRLETHDTLVVETRAPDATYDRLPREAHAAGIRIRALTSPDANLAAVFRFLVG